LSPSRMPFRHGGIRNKKSVNAHGYWEYTLNISACQSGF
jgi:hypothetical protein